MVEKISTPLDEQELVINLAPRQVEEKACVYTSMTTMLNKLWKLHDKHPDEVIVIRDDQYGTEFSVPRDWIRIQPKRQMSEEQKQQLAERLANAKRNI